MYTHTYTHIHKHTYRRGQHVIFHWESLPWFVHVFTHTHTHTHMEGVIISYCTVHSDQIRLFVYNYTDTYIDTEAHRHADVYTQNNTRVNGSWSDYHSSDYHSSVCECVCVCLNVSQCKWVTPHTEWMTHLHCDTEWMIVRWMIVRSRTLYTCVILCVHVCVSVRLCVYVCVSVIVDK